MTLMKVKTIIKKCWPVKIKPLNLLGEWVQAGNKNKKTRRLEIQSAEGIDILLLQN